MNSSIIRIFLICLASFSSSWSSAQSDKVLVIPVRQEISPSSSRLLSKGLAVAMNDSFDLVILDMNTYGGLLADADSMRTAILNFKKPVWVFINKNAASAGALISLACDRIYMQSGSNIGAATVVDQDGEKAPDKYQSYMRGLMRSTAEAKGKRGDTFIRNPGIAEAMVDQDIEIKGVSKSGEVVTLTTQEAIHYGFCDGIFEDIKSILADQKMAGAIITEYQPGTIDKLIGWLLSPAVRGILIAGIVLGLYFEIQSPGLGVPSMAALGAAILYFAPAYLEGLAENWEILLFVIGLILILLELLVIPGFGVAGISGIIITVGSLILAMLRNVQLDFSLVGFEEAFLTIAILFIITIVVVLLFLFMPSKTKNQLFSRLVLETTLEDARVGGLSGSNLEQLIGQSGVVVFECKPEGKIKIGNQIYVATAFHEVLEKGQGIKVMAIEQGKILIDHH
ncbi:nodulation protein NfeD [Bacteroidia bacterium]|nr:nodulation protein NfeD [Bacteroidia bacterium]